MDLDIDQDSSGTYTIPQTQKFTGPGSIENIVPVDLLKGIRTRLKRRYKHKDPGMYLYIKKIPFTHKTIKTEVIKTLDPPDPEWTLEFFYPARDAMVFCWSLKKYEQKKFLFRDIHELC